MIKIQVIGHKLYIFFIMRFTFKFSFRRNLILDKSNNVNIIIGVKIKFFSKYFHLLFTYFSIKIYIMNEIFTFEI